MTTGTYKHLQNVKKNNQDCTILWFFSNINFQYKPFFSQKNGI